MCVQKISFVTVLKACDYIKKRLKHTCKYSISFRDRFFYRTTPDAAFEISFSIRKNEEKKKLSGEITFALIRLFYVQIQGPANRSTTTKAFVFFQNLMNFTITKYLQQNVEEI